MSHVKTMSFPRPRVVAAAAAPEVLVIPIDDEFDIAEIEDGDEFTEMNEAIAFIDSIRSMGATPVAVGIDEFDIPEVDDEDDEEPAFLDEDPADAKIISAPEPVSVPVVTPCSHEVADAVAKAAAAAVVASNSADDDAPMVDRGFTEMPEEDPDPVVMTQKLPPPARPVPTVRDTTPKPAQPINQGLAAARVGGKLPFPR